MNQAEILGAMATVVGNHCETSECKYLERVKARVEKLSSKNCVSVAPE